MPDQILKITRAQFSEFLPNTDTIKQFEQLFRLGLLLETNVNILNGSSIKNIDYYTNIDHTIVALNYSVVMIATTKEVFVTLPAASTLKKYVFEIVAHESNAYNVNIVNTGSETLNGVNYTTSNPFYLISEEVLTVQSDGSNWRVTG